MYDHHYYNVNTIIKVLPPKEVATTLDDIISRVFKLVEDALGDEITSWWDGMAVVAPEAKERSDNVVKSC